jgi:uncharacterized membrane protein
LDWLFIVLRLIHIIAGALWVGGAIFFFFFIEPTAGELGPDAEKFMNRVVVQRRMPIYFLVTSVLTVLAGLVLYWIDSSGLRAEWITSGFGLMLTIGGLAGLIAAVAGTALIKPNVDRLAAIGGEMKAAGGPPSERQLAELRAVQARLRTIGGVDVVLLLISIAAMASARYVG